MGNRGMKGPYEPTEKCRCILPVVESGDDLFSGWGARWCLSCKRFYAWGVR